MPTDQQAASREKVVAIDPVVQLLNEEERAWMKPRISSQFGLTFITSATCTRLWAIKAPWNMSSFTRKRIWEKPLHTTQKWP
jgi:hypothetical protein